MGTPELHFSVLETKLAEYAAGQPPPLHASRWGRRFFWGTVLGILWLSAAPLLLSPSLALSIVLAVGAVVEIVGTTGLAILHLRELLPAVRNRRGKFAQLLDREFVFYREIVTWLRSHDAANLVSHLAYVRSRRDMMRRKLSLFVGGMERLGILPLLVAMYLQIHNFTTWPPPLTRGEVLAIWMLTLVYGVGWWAAGATLRMDLYEQLLVDAVEGETGGRR